MPISVQYTGQPDLERPEGIQQAVWSRIIDAGMRPDQYHPGKFKHQLILVWQLAEQYEFEKKKLPCQQTAFVSNSINSDKATLHKFIVGTLGPEIFTKPWDGAKTLDDLLIGKNCMLNIVRKIEKDKDGSEKTYMRVETVAPLMKNLSEIKVDPTVAPPKWIQIWLDDQTAKPADPSVANVKATLGDVLKNV